MKNTLSVSIPSACALPPCYGARACQRHIKERRLYLSANLLRRHAHSQALSASSFLDSVIPHTAWRDPLNFYLLIKITKLLSTVCPSHRQGRYKTAADNEEYVAAAAIKKKFRVSQMLLVYKENQERDPDSQIPVGLVWINPEAEMASSRDV